MRRVLIISPYFPPSTLAGVHRARILAKYLPGCGWEPTIVCVDERFHEEPLDPELGASVPASARVIRCGAVPARLSRRFGIGDLSLRGFMSIRRACRREFEKRRFDAVLITMGPYYTSLLAPEFKRRYGVAVVLDFQDPWVSDWGASLPIVSKGGASHWLASRLEPRAIRHADAVTAVSPGMCEDLRQRYPSIRADRLEAIPIGTDEDDFAGSRRADAVGCPDPPANATTLSYVGTYLPRAEPVLRAFLRAIHILLERESTLRDRLRLRFVGTSNQPDGRSYRRVWPVVESEGLTNIASEEPRRVPYFDAVRLLTSSTAVLALGSTEPHYTASKIFPVLLSGRPALAVFHEASSVCEIVRSAGGARLVTFRDEADLATRDREIAVALLEIIAGGAPACPPLRKDRLAKWLGPGIAAQFARVLEHTVSCR